jgi:type IV pilus assembly protein PilY1
MTIQPKSRRFPLAIAVVAAAIVLPVRLASTAVGDDLFLLTTSVSPNVVLFIDNSFSMAQIEWHRAFDPTVGKYGCDADGLNCCEDFDLSRTEENSYDAKSELASTETHCGNTRDIFQPSTPTLWDARYLNWYFSDEADPYINEIENAEANAADCNSAGSGTRFVDKYRRTRADAAKQVLLDVLCVSEPLGLRFGLAEFREAEDSASPSEDPNGGFLSVAINDATPAHAADLEASIGNTNGDAAGPLGEALFQIYTYFMSRNNSDRPVGMDGFTRFPNYSYDLRGDHQSASAKWLPDPMEGLPCRKSFVVIVTDGAPSRDDFDGDPSDTSQGFGDFGASGDANRLIGDYHLLGDGSPDETEEPGDAIETSWYLDDIARYMHEKDYRPDLDGDQTVDVYTVGFVADDATSAYLKRTAELADGLSFSAADGDTLGLALVAALNDIIEKASSFTASSVPSVRTSAGGDFYNSFFLPSSRLGFWQGHLRSWQITAAGAILDANDVCALEDSDQTRCTDGVFKSDAVYFWDAGEEMPAPGSRNLKTSKLVSGTPTLVAFDDALTAADLTIAPFVNSPPDPSPNSLLYPVVGSTALNEEGLADELVAFARGCEFGTGVTSADVTVPAACSERSWTLGDIFHSQPAIVPHPSAPWREDSYLAFKTAYAARSRRMYAGTNAGFLESFDTGSWDGSTLTYDEGTGQEVFGFMPWQARQKIKRLAIDAPVTRSHYVDGPPQATDVWIHPTPTTGVKAANGSEWRTVLAGGLRNGGRHYYALDVTNPDGIAGPGGPTLAYPAYLWEFPREDDPDDPSDSDSFLPFMGKTWGTPILTRVRLAVNGDDNGGRGFERWVVIVTGGYDPTGDPNPRGDVNGDGQPVSNETVLYDKTSTSTTSRLGRSIFVIDVKTGQVLAQKSFDDSDAADPQVDMNYAMPSTPAVLDLDVDGFADVIYVGDLGGRVWKWVIHPIGEDRVNDGTGLRTQPNWPFKLFFQAPIEKIGGDAYVKNFYFPASAALDGSRLWLALGSGERRSLAYRGNAANDENNRFYLLSDPDPFEVLASPLPTLTEADLTDITSNESGVSLTTRGYYFKASDGEKFVTNTEIFSSHVIVGSFRPTTGNSCGARGDATLYVFDLTTGKGFFTDGAGNPTRAVYIGAGLPNDPKVSVGVGGKNNKVYVEKSGVGLSTINEDDISTGGKILYWRERF